tara:strand:+ start:2026 stop:5253 length:3228 start_codon:yes stop_codon:yes gene_type:complete
MNTLSASYLLLNSLDNQVDKNRIHEGQISKNKGILTHTPLLKMPNSHGILDNIALELPSLLSVYKERVAIDSIPILDYTADALEEKYVSRASTIIGNLVHAYYYNNSSLYDPLPKSLQIAFKELSKRLGKKTYYRSMYDAFYYNWQYLNSNNRTMDFDTLGLLLPVFGDETERIFHLSVILSEYYFTEALELITLTQNAIINRDNILIIEYLDRLIDIITKIIEYVLMKVSFIPDSKYYMNPIVWGRTFAIIAQPRFKGEAGLSGVASPMFHILDNFMGRKNYDTNMGQQLTDKHNFLPDNIVEFIHAVGKVSLVDYIKKEKNNGVSRSFQRLMDVYWGEYGWLGLHRRKVFGVMHLVFKAGRVITNGGQKDDIIGNIGIETLDQDLTLAIKEREELINTCPFAKKVIAKKLTKVSNSLQLDVTNLKVRMLPGDKICLIPANAIYSTQQILKLLEVKGDECIQLNQQWKNSLETRNVKTSVIDIFTFISFMEIRQLSNVTINNIIHYFSLEGSIDKTNINGCDFYDLMFLIKNLGKNIRDIFLSDEVGYNKICDFSNPIIPRTYSISSIKEEVATVDLSIKDTDYITTIQDSFDSFTDVRKKGLINQTLIDSNLQQQVLASHIPSFNFRLNIQKSEDLIMFAAGIGISPFLSFLEKRVNDNSANNILFYSIKNLEEFHYQEELINLVKKGYLKLYLNVTSSINTKIKLEHNNIVVRYNRINTFFEDQFYLDYVKSISNYSSYIYICGNSGYSNMILDNIRSIIPSQQFHSLFAAKRVCIEVFTNEQEYQTLPSVNYSSLCSRNNKKDGYWICIEGVVYDISSYLDIHPGGTQILCSIAGMVVDYFYRKVHAKNSEADGWLGMYKIGRLNTYNNSTLYVTWVKTLNIVVEIQNIYSNNTECAQHNNASYLISFNCDNFLEVHFVYIKKTIENLYQHIKQKFPDNNFTKTLSLEQHSLTLDLFNAISNVIACYKIDMLDISKTNTRLNKSYSKVNNHILFFIKEIKDLLVQGLMIIEKYIETTQDFSCHKITLKEIIAIFALIKLKIKEHLQKIVDLKLITINELKTFCSNNGFVVL